MQEKLTDREIGGVGHLGNGGGGSRSDVGELGSGSGVVGG